MIYQVYKIKERREDEEQSSSTKARSTKIRVKINEHEKLIATLVAARKFTFERTLKNETRVNDDAEIFRVSIEPHKFLFDCNVSYSIFDVFLLKLQFSFFFFFFGKNSDELISTK